MRWNRNDQALRFERVARIDERIDTESGEFEMVMASESEASDGHILRVAGIQHPETIPLQLDHRRGAADNLGTVRNMRTGKRDGVPVLLGVGQIRLSGEGAGLELRRDLVDAIARGDLRGTSLTWSADSEHVKERTALPKGHAARVDPQDPNLRRRFGLFFEKSHAIEQSVVAIPADRSALIGRAEAAQDAARAALWQVLVERLDLREAPAVDRFTDQLSRALADAEMRLRGAGGATPPSESSPEQPPLETVLQRIAPQVADAPRRTRDELAKALEATFRQLTGGV